jgi:uncharacterized protein (DUF983 family)
MHDPHFPSQGTPPSGLAWRCPRCAHYQLQKLPDDQPVRCKTCGEADLTDVTPSRSRGSFHESELR